MQPRGAASLADYRGKWLVLLQYTVVYNLDVGRSVDETARVLAALQAGGLCPVDWKRGEKTLG